MADATPDGATPLVTIGMPVFNGDRYIRQAIDSLLDQTHDDFELVICDNASSDDTQSICEAYAAADQRVRYERQPVNRGAAANYNRAVALARGRYFKWAAHDDLVRPRFLAACLEVFARGGPDTVLAHTGSVFIGADGQVLSHDPDRLVPDSRYAPLRLASTLHNLNMVNAVFGLIRMDALRRTRLIDSFVASDYVLLAELAMLGRFARVDEPLFLRRDHPGGSRQANPSDAEAQAWFDGGSVAPALESTRSRLLREYVRSARNLDLSPASRMGCMAMVVPAVASRRMHVVGGRVKQRLLGVAAGAPS